MSTKKKPARPRDALALLKADHKDVKQLFEKFEKTRSDEKKRSLAEEALMALRVHSAIEEEIFYPALREDLKDGDILDERALRHAEESSQVKPYQELR